MPGGPEGEAPSPPSARRPSAPPASGPHHGPPPQGHGGHHRLPAPSRPGPGFRLKGPRLAPALSALALPGGKMTAPRLGDGPKERRGKPPLYLPASAGMGQAVRGKRSTTPSPRGESPPRPTSRGGAEDPRLAPVPFAQLSLRVLPHGSALAIPSEVRLRVRVPPLPPLVHLGLGPQRGSASRGRRPPGCPLH
jgi:hypothetical protein